MNAKKLEQAIDERIAALEAVAQTYSVRDAIKTLTMAKFSLFDGGSVARDDAQAVLDNTADLIAE